MYLNDIPQYILLRLVSHCGNAEISHIIHKILTAEAKHVIPHILKIFSFKIIDCSSDELIQKEIKILHAFFF